MKTLLSAVLLLGLLSCGGGVSAPADASPVPEKAPALRIVAVGDLHGDLDNTLGALRLAGLVDERGAWAGGTSVLIQTGDLMDRGDDARALLDLFPRLAREAEAASGRVINLLGNHEIMNMFGQDEAVSVKDVEAFGGSDARRRALGPEGSQGRWLRSLGIAHQEGDIIFVHGGISAAMAARGVQALNDGARQELLDGTRLLAGPSKPSGPILGREGPTWYRGYWLNEETAACQELAEALRVLGARRMVMGHTTQKEGRIKSRCGGAALAVDTGLADYAGGHLAALEILGGDARGLLPTGVEDLPDPI
jgi:hypothetical protein